MEMFKARTEFDRVFEVSIILKALDGLLETVGGLLLLAISPDKLVRLATILTQHELSHDPHDFIASHILHSTQHFAAGGSLFAAVYLLSHGVTKIVLVAEIFRGHMWAYKGMIAFLVIFIVYQVYRMTYLPSIGLVLLTIFDAFILYLTVREYRRQLRSLPPATKTA